MCKILMSIHPEFVDRIFDGTKKYEFRKTVAKRYPDKILIYETSPTSKIVGEVEVVEIIESNPIDLWQTTQKEAGIDYQSFLEYYDQREKAIAYKLGKVTRYQKKLSLIDVGVTHPPQSYVYL